MSKIFIFLTICHILNPTTAKVLEDEEYQSDVVVLGAGMSGIAAAQRLKELNKDLNVIVVEGCDRIGGRVKVSRNLALNST